MTGAGREWYRLSPSVAFQAAADIVFPPTTLQKAVVGPTPPPCWEEFAWRGIPGRAAERRVASLAHGDEGARPTRPDRRPGRPAGSARRPRGAGSAASLELGRFALHSRRRPARRLAEPNGHRLWASGTALRGRNMAWELRNRPARTTNGFGSGDDATMDYLICLLTNWPDKSDK
jgi:hypothetical protein